DILLVALFELRGDGLDAKASSFASRLRKLRSARDFGSVAICSPRFTSISLLPSGASMTVSSVASSVVGDFRQCSGERAPTRRRERALRGARWRRGGYGGPHPHRLRTARTNKIKGFGAPPTPAAL